jgi:hypothetical protein
MDQGKEAKLYHNIRVSTDVTRTSFGKMFLAKTVFLYCKPIKAMNMI